MDKEEFDTDDHENESGGSSDLSTPRASASEAARKLEIRRKIEERIEEKRLRDEYGV